MENHSTLHRSWDCVESQLTATSTESLPSDCWVVLNYLSFLICHTAPSINIQTSTEAIN